MGPKLYKSCQNSSKMVSKKFQHCFIKVLKWFRNGPKVFLIIPKKIKNGFKIGPKLSENCPTKDQKWFQNIQNCPKRFQKGSKRSQKDDHKKKLNTTLWSEEIRAEVGGEILSSLHLC